MVQQMRDELCGMETKGDVDAMLLGLLLQCPGRQVATQPLRLLLLLLLSTSVRGGDGGGDAESQATQRPSTPSHPRRPNTWEQGSSIHAHLAMQPAAWTQTSGLGSPA
jgi:hypothetical protein